MPKKESKIAAMLQDMGIMRLSNDGSEKDFSADTVNDSTQDKPDIKALIDFPDGSAKPVAKQPAPAVSASPATQPDKAPASVIAQPVAPAVEVTPPTFAKESAPAPTPAVATTGVYPFRSQRTESMRNELDSLLNEPPVAEPSANEMATRPDNYTEKYLNIEELYDALSLKSKKTDTIYLIEEYLETLPAALPDATRRDIVGKLLAASGFDYDLLMGDGVLRVKMLKEYAERFAQHTDDFIASRQAEIDEYEQQILRLRQLVDNRRELHKKQFYTIEAEAQRLKEILTFISGQ